MLNELRNSIATAIHQHQQSGIDELQKCFERDIEKFPENLEAVANGIADERMQEEVVKALECYYSWTKKYELIKEIEGGLRWAISKLVDQLPTGGRCVLESLVTFFGKVVISDHFHHLGVEWVKAAQNSNDAGVCLAYCEIVDAGLAYKAFWEASVEGKRLEKRTVKLYSILCDQNIWLQKRQILSHYFVDHPVLARSFLEYLTVPSTSSRFDDVKRYVARQKESLPLHYDENQRDKTIKELDSAIRILQKKANKCDKYSE